MRRPVGVDAGLASNSNVIGGVLIHQANPTDSNSIDLLDMTAADTSWTNPALVTGQSFTDSGPKITIAPVSVGSIGTVTVTIGSLPTCTRESTVSFSPSQGPSVAAGTPSPSLLGDQQRLALRGFDLRPDRHRPVAAGPTYSASSLTPLGRFRRLDPHGDLRADRGGRPVGFTGKATNRARTSSRRRHRRPTRGRHLRPRQPDRRDVARRARRWRPERRSSSPCR
jgi:hypothetical protein